MQRSCLEVRWYDLLEETYTEFEDDCTHRERESVAFIDESFVHKFIEHTALEHVGLQVYILEKKRRNQF